MNEGKRYNTNNQLDLRFIILVFGGYLGEGWCIMGRKEVLDYSFGKEKDQKVSHVHPFLIISSYPWIKNEFSI